MFRCFAPSLMFASCSPANVDDKRTTSRMPFDAPIGHFRGDTNSGYRVRPSSAASIRPRDVVRLTSKRTVDMQRFRWLEPDEQHEPQSVTSRQRLLAAQRKVEAASCALKHSFEGHSLRRDDALDALSSMQTEARLHRGAPESHLVESVLQRSGFDSTGFTPLDPEAFEDEELDVPSVIDVEQPADGGHFQTSDEPKGALNKGRALFQNWWRKAKHETHDFNYHLVWVSSVLQQLRHSTEGLKKPSTYRLLTSISLLISSLDVAVPDGQAKSLTFNLLDEVLSGIFEEWGGPPANDDPHRASRSNSPRDTSMCGTLARTREFEVLGQRRLYCETWRIAELKKQRAVTECRQRLDLSKREARQRESVFHERLAAGHKVTKSLIFCAWKKQTWTTKLRKTGATNVINGLNRKHENVLMKLTMLAFQFNRMSEQSQRTHHSDGDRTRDWREKEANLIHEVSQLKAKIALTAAEHQQSLETLEESHWTAQHKLLDDTQGLRDRAASDAAKIEELTEQRDEQQRQRDEWRHLCNILLSELSPVPRNHPMYDLLFTETDAGHKLQITPFSSLVEVVTSPSAAVKLLLLYANTLLRKERPEHPPIENLGLDLADCEVYICSLTILFPGKMTKRAFEISANAQRAQEVCRVLGEVGLDTLVAPVDIVLGVVLRNLALLTTLFRLHAATTRHGTTLRSGAGSIAEVSPDVTQLLQPQVLAPDGTVSRFRLIDVSEARRITMDVLQGSRAWSYLSDFVQRDTMQKIQNVRREGEVLDERSRRQMEWFLSFDEEKVIGVLLRQNPSNTANEQDKISAVLGSLGFDLLSLYFGYAVSDQGVRMTQAALLKVFQDSQISASTAVLEEAYRFATGMYVPGEGIVNDDVFAPTATGANKRKLTANMAGLQVPPRVLIHVLLYLAHYKYVLGGPKRGKAKDPLNSTLDSTLNSTIASSADRKDDDQLEVPAHHTAIRRLIEDDILPRCKASSADRFKSQAHNVVVQQVYRKHHKQLTKAFKSYCSRSVDGDVLIDPKGDQQTLAKLQRKVAQRGIEAYVMTSDDFYRFFRDTRLIDAKLPASEIASIFLQLLNSDGAKLMVICQSHPNELEDVKTAGIGYGDWLDAITAVAVFRTPSPFLPVHAKVELLFKELLVQRLKEVCQ